MKILGLLFLLAAGFLWLPTLCFLISPLWWHDWFGDPATPPTPGRMAGWIAASSQLATLGTGMGIVGIVLLILGVSSDKRAAHDDSEP